MHKSWWDRDIDVEDCDWCGAPIGKPCISVLNGNIVPFTHAMPNKMLVNYPREFRYEDGKVIKIK